MLMIFSLNAHRHLSVQLDPLNWLCKSQDFQAEGGKKHLNVSVNFKLHMVKGHIQKSLTAFCNQIQRKWSSL